MSASLERLLGLLADGGQRSGEELAGRLGVTRTTVWNLVRELREKGVEITSVDRRGYRLPERVELLDVEAMRRAVPPGMRLPEELRVAFELESTNASLFDDAAQAPAAPRVLFAELQTAGRGRRGRRWFAPFGSGLTFSIAWCYAETPADLPALTLALGVGAATALHQAGAVDIGLKWPNDLVTPHGKLGGLLTQLRHEPGGPVWIVTGLGLNLRLPERVRSRIETSGGLAPTDLQSSLGAAPGRNAIAASLAAHMVRVLEDFATAGFAPYIERWRRFDTLAGRPVRVQHGDRWIDGVARGVDRDGALVVEREGERMRVHSGDVSVRAAGGSP